MIRINRIFTTFFAVFLCCFVSNTLATAQMCSGALSVSIIGGTPPMPLATPIDNVNCATGTFGVASVNPNGGTAPYNYVWSNGGNTPNINNLTAGTYSVSVTDHDGCTASATVVIAQTGTLVPTFSGNTTLDCSTTTSTLTAASAGTPTSFAWGVGAVPTAAGSASAVVSHEGTYAVSVTTDNGCSGSGTVTVIHTCMEVYEPADTVCNASFVSQGVAVNGTSWTQLRNSNGRVIAAINPMGFDMGLVTAQVHLYGTVPHINHEYYLPRYFDFTVEHQPPVGTDVQVRLYFTNNDLNVTNAADPMPDQTRSELYMLHYNGVNTDCDIYNSTGTFDIKDPTIVNDAQFGLSAFYLDAPFSSFSEFGAKLTPNPLPVKLIYFKGRTDNKTNFLDWRTASEQNSAFFSLERSDDGSNFKQVTNKAAAGNSTTPRDYAYNDDKAGNSSYYRLRMVDLDGTFAYSNIVYLEHRKGKLGIANLYPNPTLDNVTIEYETEDATAVTFTIFDALGQQVAVEKVTPKKGANVHTLSLNDLAAGMYMIAIDTEGSKRVVRKVVKN
jgi:hypothetical protein